MNDNHIRILISYNQDEFEIKLPVSPEDGDKEYKLITQQIEKLVNKDIEDFKWVGEIQKVIENLKKEYEHLSALSLKLYQEKQSNQTNEH